MNNDLVISGKRLEIPKELQGLLSLAGEQVTTTSRTVAERFGKRHDNILQAIRTGSNRPRPRLAGTASRKNWAGLRVRKVRTPAVPRVVHFLNIPLDGEVKVGNNWCECH